MDSILTDFIQRSSADPALARDLLEATNWDMDAAMIAYESLQETRAVEPPEYQYDPKDFESICHVSEGIQEREDSDFVPEDMRPSVLGVGGEVEENEAKRREVVRKRRTLKQSRGLSFIDADEVIQKFNQVAITKQRVSSKEQVIIDEKFFHHSFVYPDFSSEGDKLKEYISLDLLEASHKRALENSGRLNWWTSTGRLPRLEPLATSGDGNCLLHAASLYMWGFHDHYLILRTALHRLLTMGLEKEGLKRRWKYQTQLRNDTAGGLMFSEEEWEFEWEEILRIATNRPRQVPTTDSLRRYSSLRVSYESLEEVHISVLAHTLRRPVIVLSDRTIKDMNGQDLAPIYFGGIYLPLEVNPTACHKSPVVLAYDSSHFSPLVARQDDYERGKQRQRSKYVQPTSRTETVIPLVSPDGSLLPVQFIYDPLKKNVEEKWSRMEYEVGEFPDDIVCLLESYLNLRWIQLKVAASDVRNAEDTDRRFPIEVPQVRFPAASIARETQPIYQKELVEKYLDHIKVKFREEEERKARREAEREEEEKKRLLNKIVACEGEGCDMFGRPATNNLCSVCYQKYPRIKSSQEENLGMTGVQGGDDEVDVANLHRRIGATPPPSNAQELGSDEQSGVLSGVPGTGGGLQVDCRRESPRHTVTSVGSNAARQVLMDQTNSSKKPSVPPKRQKSHVEESQPKSNVSALQEQEARKQPLIPPGQSKISGDVSRDTSSQRLSRSHSPSTPAPPLPPKVQGTGPTSKGATPISPVKSRGAPPPPPKQTQTLPNNLPSKQAGESQESKPVSKSWTSNFAPKKAPKTPAKGGGSQYSRDNILPLHLEPVQGNPKETASKVVTSTKKPCNTLNCDFFGSTNTGGYCSGCYKRLRDGATPV